MKVALQISIILLLSCAAFSQSTKIRSVTSLPATCSPGDSIQPADIVALASGGTTTFEICRVTNTWAPLVPDPGSNGVIVRSAANTTRIATSTDIISLWTGSCNSATVLFGDGTCGNSGVQTPACPGLLPVAYFPNGSLASIQGDCLFQTDGNGNVFLKSITGTGSGTTVFTGNSGTTPSVPGGSSQYSLYVDSGTNLLNCLLHSGASCMPVTSVFGRNGAIVATAGDYTWDKIGAGSNLNTQSMGNGGSLRPVNLGQIAGNQAWLQPGLSAPTATATLTGGTIGSGQTVLWNYTLNTASGQTIPSPQLSQNMVATGCTSGGSCTATLVAPTLPSGYSGYTAYFCDISGAACTAPVEVLACVNISANCTVTAATLNSGIALPTINTAIIDPPNVQATNGPTGWTPSIYFPKADGNYYPWLGIEWATCGSGGPSVCGTPLFSHRTYFSDQQNFVGGVAGKNSFIVMDHLSGIGIDPVNNQERTLWVNFSNTSTDASQHYSMTGIQTEVDVNGAPTWTGAVDGETAAGSYQLQDATTNAAGTPNGGNHVIRASYFSRPTGTGLTPVYGIQSDMSSVKPSGSYSNALFGAYLAQWETAGGTNSSLSGIGYQAKFPSTGTKFATNIGLYFTGSMSVGATDFLIRSDQIGLPATLNGVTTVSGLNNNNVVSFPINASASLTGSLSVNQTTTLSGSYMSVSCTGGASTYGYAIVWVDANGGTAPSTTVTTPGTCVNPLTSGNPVSLVPIGTFQVPATLARVVSVDVYRVSGPMGTGKIGSFSCQANGTGVSCNTFSDTGLTAVGTIPTTNTTGGAQFAGYVGHTTNTVRVGPSGFTTAANTNLQTITGLTWNLDSGAKNYSFHCALSYSQATANAAVAFGIQAATNAPTNIFGNGIMQITVGPPATEVNATLATLSTTTATAIVSGTPGATATNFIANLDGSIEEPANSNGNIINVMVSTATSGDAVTVLRGSYCYLY